MMVERMIVREAESISYEGYFDAEGLYLHIDNWFRNKAYIKKEIRHSEMVYPDGKQISIQNEPYKKVNDYCRNVIVLTIDISGLKTVEIDKKGKKMKVNEGSVEITMTPFLELDYEHRWENKPTFFFISTLFDQFVFKYQTDNYKKSILQDCTHLKQEIRRYLNLFKY